MRSRRSVLAGLGVLALAGCMGPEAESGAPDDTPSSGGGAGATPASNETTGNASDESDASGESEASAGDESEGSDEEPTVESRGPVRAEGDARPSVTVEEDDENVEFADDGDVRFVAAWRHTNHDEVEEGEPPEREPVYETSEWERWSRIQCVSAASDAAVEHVRSELGVESIGSAVSSAIEGETVSAVVSTSTTLDRDGDVVGESTVDFETLRETTPRSVEATYVLEDRERTMDVPIYVRHTVMQYD